MSSLQFYLMRADANGGAMRLFVPLGF